MSQHTGAVSGTHPPAEAARTAAVMGPPAERDRRRYAWMYEDEDIWGTEGADCVPPPAHGHDWHAPRV